MNTNFSFLSEITGLTGGSASALDGIDPKRLSLPYFAKARIITSDGNKQMQGWLCRTRVDGEVESSGALAAEDFRFVVPDNWHATENNTIWERVE
jgi:hypothetical protein